MAIDKGKTERRISERRVGGLPFDGSDRRRDEERRVKQRRHKKRKIYGKVKLYSIILIICVFMALIFTFIGNMFKNLVKGRISIEGYQDTKLNAEKAQSKR